MTDVEAALMKLALALNSSINGSSAFSIWLRDLLTSDIFLTGIFTLLSGLSGAYFGAKLQRDTTERHTLKKELLSEIRTTQILMSFAFNALNKSWSVKRQNIAPTLSRYYLAKQRLQCQVAAGIKPAVFQVSMESIQGINLESEAILANISQNINATPLLVASAVATRQSEAAFNDTNSKINKFFDKWSENLERPTPMNYFSIEMQGSPKDSRFSDLQRNIELYTDDCVYFSYVLCEEAHQHLSNLIKAYEKKFGKDDTPKLTTYDASAISESYQFPDKALYEKWFSGFQTEPY